MRFSPSVARLLRPSAARCLRAWTLVAVLVLRFPPSAARLLRPSALVAVASVSSVGCAGMMTDEIASFSPSALVAPVAPRPFDRVAPCPRVVPAAGCA